MSHKRRNYGHLNVLLAPEEGLSTMKLVSTLLHLYVGVQMLTFLLLSDLNSKGNAI
jgi:hypothetical protein